MALNSEYLALFSLKTSFVIYFKFDTKCELISKTFSILFKELFYGKFSFRKNVFFVKIIDFGWFESQNKDF